MALAVLATGVIAGYLVGGRLRGIATLRLRGIWLVWLPVLLSLLASFPLTSDLPGLSQALVPLATGAIGAFLLGNALLQRARVRIPLALMALGWFLNWAVIVTNGGMPVPRDLLEGPERTAGLYALAGMHLAPHAPITPSTRLPWLGDVLRVRAPEVIIPFSVGDALLVVGTILLIALAMRTGSTRPSAGSRHEPHVAPAQARPDAEGP